jgi:hypothetical protein
MERLMALDGVLAEPSVTWLGAASDKVATFTAPPCCVPARTALPWATRRGAMRRLSEQFPIDFAPENPGCFSTSVTTGSRP